MALRVEPSSPQDLDAIRPLLTTAFGAPTDAFFADRSLLAWKYFERYGEGSVPRSYVLKQGDAILAHCVASPLTLCVPRADTPGQPAERLRAVTFMDWVAGTSLPGAGVILMKKLMSEADAVLVAGGSDATRQTLPKLGFVTREPIGIYIRVVRPWRQFNARPSPSVKDAARLLRNAIWSRRPAGSIDPAWRAEQVRTFTALPPTGDGGGPTIEHSPEFWNYWLRCPAATVSGFQVYRGEEIAGTFLISRVGGSARIAAVRSRTTAPADAVELLRLAVQAAATDPSTCEITGTASAPAVAAALRACGFRHRGALPLFLYDPGKRLAATDHPAWNPIDDDFAYVCDPANPFHS